MECLRRCVPMTKALDQLQETLEGSLHNSKLELFKYFTNCPLDQLEFFAKVNLRELGYTIIATKMDFLLLFISP